MKKRVTALLLAVMMTFNMEGIVDAAGVKVPQTTDQETQNAMSQQVQTGDQAQEDNTSVTENPCSALKFSSEALSLLAGETNSSVRLEATTAQPQDEMTGNLVLESSDTAVAQVEAVEKQTDGTPKPGAVKITAGSKSGTATITATATGLDQTVVTAHFTVTVKAPKTVTITALTQTAYNKASLVFAPGSTEDADGYVIQRKAAGESQWTEVKKIASTGNFSYSATGLVTGTKYSFRVCAYLIKADGTYLYGTPSAVSTITTKPDQAKISTVSSAAYNKLKLTWQKVAGASGYHLYRSTSADGTYKRIAIVTGGSKVSYTDSKSIATGTRYYYKVRAYRTVNGAKVYGSYSNVKSGKAVPAIPTLSSVKSASYNQLTVTWKKTVGASGYQIYYATSKNGTYKRAKTVSGGSKLSATISGMSTGKKYYIKVRAFRTVKGSRVYGTFSNIRTGTAICARPAGVKAVSVNANKVTISWKKVAGAQYYVVTRSTSKNGTYKTVKKKCTTLSYTNGSLTNGTKYYYKVYAVRGTTKGSVSAAVTARAKSLTITRRSISVHKGEVAQLIINASPATTVRWSSSNPSVATVSSTGLVSAVNLGTTKITVKAHGFTKNITVTVKNRLNGIDVSKWQGDINWNAVASSGISFAMLRVWHTAGTVEDSKDICFEANYSGARAAGIKVGCYAYSTANSVEAATAEAQNVIRILNGRTMEYPVVMDMESSNALGLTNAQRTDMIFAFKSVIESHGYKFALYANTYWLDHYIDNSRLNGMDIWVARYKADTTTGYEYAGGGNVVMWQHSNTGSVNGINGPVDLDYGYKPY